MEDIEKIEERRPMNKDMDAVYLLSPLPHIVDCLLADFDRRRYRRAFILWTARQRHPNPRLCCLLTFRQYSIPHYEER